MKASELDEVVGELMDIGTRHLSVAMLSLMTSIIGLRGKNRVFGGIKMKTYIDPNYGADADGNRGRETLMYELEDTPKERQAIADELVNLGYTIEDKGILMLTFEGVNIEIYIQDYHKEMQNVEL